ncbi:hypothetical protein OUZ56_028999 [Daphnia magna]|uniref:Uncharacterized protein n=1 Tax=Daphnia magna TaxID=35525 RepID=A0ABR0B5J5_9CRUS|nr:hypothetical protein OUZ56_028999 [Daphnia magna]
MSVFSYVMCHYFPADTQYLRINRHFDRNDQQETKERARANHKKRKNNPLDLNGFEPNDWR